MKETVAHADGTGGADRGAIAVPQATKAAGIGPAVEHRCGIAGLNTVVFRDRIGGIAMAVAGVERHLIFKGLDLDAHNGTDLVGHIFSAGDAKVGFGSSFRHRRGIIVAPLIAAGTAVDTGQAGADFLHLGVDLHHKKMGEEQ